MFRTLSVGAVLIAAGTAAAQRPVPTVSPPILNPQVQQYIAPRTTRYIPPRDHITRSYDKDIVLIEAEPEVLVTPHHRAK